MSAIGPKQTSAIALHMSAFGGKADIVDERRVAFGCSHLQARARGYRFKKLGSPYRSGQDQGQESEVASSNQGHGWNVLKRGLISRRLNTYLRAAGRRRNSVPK